MLITHDGILQLIAHGVVLHAPPELVNGSSLDVTLSNTILIERLPNSMKEPEDRVVDYRARTPLPMNTYVMGDDGYILAPGEFVLASSQQVFNLPLDVSADYKLKSSMARIGLEHLNAGWCDPGWHSSVLTLELINLTRWAHIRIRPGDRIGQVVFFRHRPIRCENSYAVRGRYNGDGRVHGIKP